MKQIYANNFTTLALGRQGENLARQVVFDVRDLESLYGPGDVEVIYQRPGDAQPYPLAVQRDGTLVTWDVTATDTEMSDGYGKCELRYYVGETLAKSKIWRTWVEPAMDTPSETAPPEPEQGWVDQIIAVGAAAKASADAAKAQADAAAQSASGAAQSAQEAAGSASAASTSETNAKASEVSAKASETAAQASKTAAAGSASAAKNSAASASAAASAAAESASTAQQSATSAAESAAVYDTVVADVNQLKQDVAAITPDDTVVDGKPWTSKKTVDALCARFEETGNPVQVYPVENYPLDVKVSWEPVQEGSGDPSPDNIRPITGRNSVTITHSSDVVSNDYNITLPETVYGGTLDVETGVLTVDTDVKQFDGTENWRYSSANNVFYVTTDVAYKIDSFMCSHYKAKVGMSNIEDKMAAISAGAKNWHVIIRDDEYGGNVTLFKTRLSEMKSAGKPLQVSRVREDPYTIQLTPQQIAALYGVNTIYTDADGVVVTGAEDPKHTITELKNAIISLGGNI